MRKLIIGILMLSLSSFVLAGVAKLENYVDNFDYAARKDMKMDSKGLIKLLKEGKAQLIDIRFKEEYAAWKVGPSISIHGNRLLHADGQRPVLLLASIYRGKS